MSLSTSFLNDVKFESGNVVTLTDLGRQSIRTYIKANKTLGLVGEKFEIISTRVSEAMDEFTELTEPTIGATGLKCIRTGEVFDISDNSDPILWAFFTESTPHFFDKVVHVKQS